MPELITLALRFVSDYAMIAAKYDKGLDTGNLPNGETAGFVCPDDVFRLKGDIFNVSINDGLC